MLVSPAKSTTGHTSRVSDTEKRASYKTLTVVIMLAISSMTEDTATVFTKVETERSTKESGKMTRSTVKAT
jgi:hypothetical protein